jgi:hypothetical protein
LGGAWYACIYDTGGEIETDAEGDNKARGKHLTLGETAREGEIEDCTVVSGRPDKGSGSASICKSGSVLIGQLEVEGERGVKVCREVKGVSPLTTVLDITPSNSIVIDRLIIKGLNDIFSSVYLNTRTPIGSGCKCGAGVVREVHVERDS